MAETIDHGVSGFVVDSLEKAIDVLPRTLALDRNEVRRCFERRFDAARMVDDYFAIYASMCRMDAQAVDCR